jgi:RNA-directed DNA polymerase
MLPNPTTHLLDQILEPDNLNAAWERVRKNKGAAGIDGMTTDRFVAYFKTYGKGLVEEIRQGRYRPYPVKRVYIDKDDGSQRGLGIPTVFDRVIQQAIVLKLTPIFDPHFSEFSYGFRTGHSQHQAVRQVQEYVGEGRRTAVDVDLSKFFDRVNHDLLMTKLGQTIRDKRLLKLIAHYLRAGFVEDGVLNETREGVPQGGPLSPLLSNIILDPLDKELKKRGHKFARYADDFIILVYSKRAGDRVLKSVTNFVERKLKLQVNEQKSQVVKANQCKFLGFRFVGKQLEWHPKAFAKFMYNVKTITGRSRGVSPATVIKELTQYLRGWINYFGIARGYQRCIDLDGWIRRRLRSYFWKQWKKTRTRVRNLIRLGVPKDIAIPVGSSNKSYWKNSRTPAINMGLSNEYFEKRGLFLLTERWVEIHYR